jgi:hypothetical protein
MSHAPDPRAAQAADYHKRLEQLRERQARLAQQRAQRAAKQAAPSQSFRHRSR